MAPHRRMVHLEGSGDQSELCSLTVMEKTSHRTPKSPQVPAVDYKQREGPEMGRVEGQDHHLWPEPGGAQRLLLFTKELSDAQAGSPLHKQSHLC